MSEKKAFQYLLVILVLGVCSVSPASGETAGRQDLPVRLDEAVDVALHNRLELVIASKQRVSAAFRTKVAKGSFLPQIAVSGTSRYIRSLDTFSGIEADARLGDQNFHVSVQKVVPAYELHAGLDLTYNLFSGGRDTAAVEETLAEQAALKHEEAATKARVSLEVMNAYWSLRKSQVLSRLAERAYLHATRLLLIAEAKRSSGLTSEIEVESEMVSVKEAMLAVNHARRDEARSLAKYRESLGLYQADLVPTGGGTVSLLDDPDETSTVDVVEATDRPETLKSESEAVAAEARVRQSRAAYLPTIDLFANYKMVGRDSDYFKSTLLKSDYYTVGVNVSFTLFDGLRDRIALANSEKDIARMRVMQTIKQLDARNEDMIIENDKLQNEVIMAEQRLKLYDMKKQLAEERYSNGKISRIELNEAEKNYEDFADKFLIAKIDAAVAKQSLSISNRIN